MPQIFTEKQRVHCLVDLFVALSGGHRDGFSTSLASDAIEPVKNGCFWGTAYGMQPFSVGSGAIMHGTGF